MRRRALGLLWLALVLPALCSSVAAEPLKLGLYPGGSISTEGAQIDTVNAAIRPRAVQLGLLGDFMLPGLTSLDRLTASLETAWQRGAIPIINVMATEPLGTLWAPTTPAQWASYWVLWEWAATIRAWGAQGEGRHVYLVLFPEFNGAWTPYHDTGANVAEAFRLVRYLFHLAGALPVVRIVWSPNVADAEELVPSYPGAGWTDVVGCSAYQELRLVRHCVEALRRLAPGVPILLTQTGACQPGSEAFATALVAYLRRQPDAIGFVWFDFDKTSQGECDWQLGAGAWRRAMKMLDPRITD